MQSVANESAQIYGGSDVEELWAKHVLSMCKIGRRKYVGEKIIKRELCAVEILNSKLLNKKFKISDVKNAIERAKVEKDLIEKEGILFSFIGEPGYPNEISALDSPPFMIRWQGEIKTTSLVAIVGSRAALRRDMDHAYDLAGILVSLGHGIISGGAYGIDGAAHRGTLAADGYTMVFSGSGLLHPYPDRHESLFKEVVRSGGCVISVMPVNSPPYAYSFLQRNRFIAALAKELIIVSAKRKSGALSTAGWGNKLIKTVYAIEGSDGCDLLLKQNRAIPWSLERFFG